MIELVTAFSYNSYRSARMLMRAQFRIVSIPEQVRLTTMQDMRSTIPIFQRKRGFNRLAIDDEAGSFLRVIPVLMHNELGKVRKGSSLTEGLSVSGIAKGSRSCMIAKPGKSTEVCRYDELKPAANKSVTFIFISRHTQGEGAYVFGSALLSSMQP